MGLCRQGFVVVAGLCCSFTANAMRYRSALELFVVGAIVL